jgi:hypothetical protein
MDRTAGVERAKISTKTYDLLNETDILTRYRFCKHDHTRQRERHSRGFDILCAVHINSMCIT